MKYSDITLPKAWFPRRVKSALLNAMSLAHTSITFSRAWCADSSIRRVQLAGELDRALYSLHENRICPTNHCAVEAVGHEL